MTPPPRKPGLPPARRRRLRSQVAELALMAGFSAVMAGVNLAAPWGLIVGGTLALLGIVFCVWTIRRAYAEARDTRRAP